MTENKNITPFEQNTEDVISKTLTALAEGITGIGASDKNQIILSIGHIFQKMRGGQFLSKFMEEWNKYRAKGKVKDDYPSTEQHRVCLQELLEFLDKDSPSEVRFKIINRFRKHCFFIRMNVRRIAENCVVQNRRNIFIKITQIIIYIPIVMYV